ncbi:MAG: exonuclease domain-containing protein, partial [Gammaproteobacteria bacterium]|nr:exonuclease domain-containing protein [Gammaproteobacteria bacterium]
MSMTARQIVVDTETTGVEVAQGHRVIEIGCVEMVARRLTGNTFHHYLNPKRDIDEAAAEVHGITAEQLADKPEFAEVARELLEFIKGAELIIHNAPFDVGFLNNEFKLAGIAVGDGDGDGAGDGAGDGDAGGKGKGGVIEAHCEVTDTLAMAREQF